MLKKDGNNHKYPRDNLCDLQKTGHVPVMLTLPTDYVNPVYLDREGLLIPGDVHSTGEILPHGS